MVISVKTPALGTSGIRSLLISLLVGVIGGLVTEDAGAEVSSHSMSDFTAAPINLSSDAVSPHVMINTSNDHQFYFKAYNDYSDLNNDETIETTYEHSIDYYGYFDSYKCYDYGQASFDVNGSTSLSADDKIFFPVYDTTSDNVNDADINGDDKYCTGANDGYWSGNFLNWVTMARIDTIRKILFGGFRRVDTGSHTVLERTYLPHDAHSWAKYYNGADLEELTPFQAGVHYLVNDPDPKKNGITFANTTDVSNTNIYSHEVPDQVDGSNHWRNPDPPLMKVAKGNYSLWASNERWQCTWADTVTDRHSGTNDNDAAKSGIYAYSSSPGYSKGIGEKDYFVRVEACKSGLIGAEKCKQYPDGNYKPIGLLQRWGDDNELLFGMMTGTYQKHAKGGELATDIRSMQEEVNVATDGTFKLTTENIGGPVRISQARDSLINIWSLYRIYGYNHSDGTYNSSQGDNCSWGLSDLDQTAADGKCTNWGNPFSEIYLQSLRYMAGLGIDGTFRANDSNYIAGYHTPSNWQNPLYECNACARLNIINFNSSVMSYDYDDIDHQSNGPHTIFYDQTEHAGIQLPGDTSNHSILMTDVVGKGEGYHGESTFIGEADVTDQNDSDDQLCTPKEITSFGSIGGICPEGPRLQGSYRVAGLAYYAHVYDIRPGDSDPQVDCGTNPGTTQGQRNLSGKQTIDTFSVSMATAVPTFEIPDPLTGEKAVTLLPACRNTSLNPEGNCAIVDFKVVEQVTNDGTGTGTGKLYVNWEDSEQGGDYDQDMWGVIEYEINGNTISITTDAIGSSASYTMGFGYIISGTLEDGFHAHSGILNYTHTETATMTGGSDCSSGCNIGDNATTATYTLGSADVKPLKDPLWYAAKWGGFVDLDGNKLPFDDQDGDGVEDPGEETQAEWDNVINATGAEGQDDIPDNYFYVTNPQELEDSLNRVFLSIIERTSSGTAAAVVANNIRGEGALYQAYYEPLKKDDSGNEVQWIGSLTSMWLDSAGYMREDRTSCVDPDEDGVSECLGGLDNGSTCTGVIDCRGSNHILDDYETDRVIETYYDDTDNRTRVRRWLSNDAETFDPYVYQVIDLNDIAVLWNARESLAQMSDNLVDVQRNWSDVGGSKRYIKTWLDRDLDGLVDGDEFVDFDTANTDGFDLPARYGFFDVADSAEAQALIDYIRGKETSGFRNRTVDYDKDGSTEVLRLGDIVNSTPTVVSAPLEAFNLLYSDSSYAPFVSKYQKRRNVIYVGANDGMLHAFNGGFYLSDQAQFTTYRPKPKRLWADPKIPEYYDNVADPSYCTPHPLGSEIWAYVPMNLLPHLKWLKNNYYSHVYYVDGKPRVFDARIFAEEGACTPTDKSDVDCIHPNGWGTVLVVGMRLGGSPMTIDTAGDGLGNPNAADDRTMSSAYAIFDITDPESPPDLLGEIAVPNGSYSMVYPTVVAVKNKIPALDPNKWYLVFGNGPDNLIDVDSASAAELYVFDLAELATPGVTSFAPTFANDCSLGNLGQTSMEILTCETGIDNSFVGSPVSVDWDLDYRADTLYFGLVGWREERSGSDTLKYVDGRLMRLGVNEESSPSNWSGPMTVIDTRQPVYAPISLGVDKLDNRWLFFGTGRFLSSLDRDTSDPNNQTSLQTQSIYGLKDLYSPHNPFYDEESEAEIIRYDSNGATVDDDLIDTTNILVYNDFSITGGPTSSGDGSPITTLSGLVDEIGTYKDGWFIDLPPIAGLAGVAPATRGLSQPGLLGGILFNTVYQPSTDPCTGEGLSRLYGLYYLTGTAYPGVLGSDSTDVNGEGYERALSYFGLGRGYSTSPSIHTGTERGSDEVSVFTQLSTGNIFRKEAGTSDDVRSGKVSWKTR